MSTSGPIGHGNPMNEGAPVIVGGKAVTSTPAAVDNGDAVTAYFDEFGRQHVVSEGGVAAGATDSGNPVKVAGKHNTTAPTLTDGQRGDLQLDSRGATRVALMSGDVGSFIKASTTGDGAGSTLLSMGQWVYNGTALATGWERLRTPVTFKSFSGTVITSETTIWTPAAGKKFRLMGFLITQGVATGAVTLKDNTAGTTILVIPQHTIGVALASPKMGNGILSAAANNVLTATGVSTETISGYVFGTEE